MCETCGCGQPDNQATIRKPGEDDHEHEHVHGEHHHGDKDHKHDREYEHEHEHEHDGSTHYHSHRHKKDHEHEHQEGEIHTHKVVLEENIMQKNDNTAKINRTFFNEKKILALNLVSSPGSGKTSLLERTINEMKQEMKCYVIEGDQQTMNDANRIHATGAPVVQINTGNGCHLDAEMVSRAVKKLDMPENVTLFIENVGNLVCPALFDLGEAKRVVIVSITEGEDKPLKYPNMFMSSQLCIINKTDLLPYLDIDVAKLKEYAKAVNDKLEFIELSVKTGFGIGKWYEWLKQQKQL